MRAIFDRLNDWHGKYYSPTELLAVDEIIVHFEGRIIFTVYTKETQAVWDRALQALWF